ncbi:FAD-binding domain-containing protein [Hypomontagnella monticulosa]|nr:FAD-binding domain-containing protein [Hypomontagnella monticulosa]
MRSPILLGLLATIGFGVAKVCATIDSDLKPLLSKGASISHDLSVAPRWSEFNPPQPGTIVSVATEDDVAKTVQYCNKKKIPFLAQNGGHGWIDSWHLGKNGVVINLRGLNSVTVSEDKTKAYIGGGAAVKEVIDAVYNADAQVITGNCNCVGVLGAGLGGGYGNLCGIYGLSVDNYLSLNVVLANGSLVTVTPAQKDLWWALRGAGPNFGIVTSAVQKAKPLPKAQNTAWTGALFFSEDKLEQVVQAIEDIKLEAPMNIFLYFATSGAPDFTPIVFVTPFYFGTEEQGKAAFKSFYDLGPYQDTTQVLPQNEWNTGADGFCIKGDRKPSWSAGLSHMVPATWRQVFNEYSAFVKNNGTGSSSIVVECYSLDVAQSVPADSASFANRDVRFNAIAIAWYPDTSLDAAANSFGMKTRDLWRSTDGFPSNRTYVNFAYGDETNDVVYHGSTSRLKQLKRQYDPYNVFNQWFDI